MRILADVHISPRTIEFLNIVGHDTIPVGSVLPVTASDESIIETAVALDRVVLTQDLGFAALLATSGAIRPSIVTLRLDSPRVELVNRALESFLPTVESDIALGVAVTIQDDRMRMRRLPLLG